MALQIKQKRKKDELSSSNKSKIFQFIAKFPNKREEHSSVFRIGKAQYPEVFLLQFCNKIIVTKVFEANKILIFKRVFLFLINRAEEKGLSGVAETGISKVRLLEVPITHGIDIYRAKNIFDNLMIVYRFDYSFVEVFNGSRLRFKEKPPKTVGIIEEPGKENDRSRLDDLRSSAPKTKPQFNLKKINNRFLTRKTQFRFRKYIPHHKSFWFFIAIFYWEADKEEGVVSSIKVLKRKITEVEEETPQEIRYFKRQINKYKLRRPYLKY
ncbi:hypothetical protein BpHYR1_019843 [Brachionus plicatilis]|uniref:Uncharacterized protein n=1 Tax=Brachionus plicatilis TaxID=10195 RepID=A0A3M7RSZ1_BRAPC|nr:hypothetical protein BpHYR1_019843 [Brachionus plicatilis]